jgi:hypothetical protein
MKRLAHRTRRNQTLTGHYGTFEIDGEGLLSPPPDEPAEKGFLSMGNEFMLVEVPDPPAKKKTTRRRKKKED